MHTIYDRKTEKFQTKKIWFFFFFFFFFFWGGGGGGGGVFLLETEIEGTH